MPCSFALLSSAGSDGRCAAAGCCALFLATAMALLRQVAVDRRPVNSIAYILSRRKRVTSPRTGLAPYAQTFELERNLTLAGRLRCRSAAGQGRLIIRVRSRGSRYLRTAWARSSRVSGSMLLD